MVGDLGAVIHCVFDFFRSCDAVMAETRVIMRPRLAISSLLLLASLPALAQTTTLAPNIWYVDGVHGNDNNDCKSPSAACKTIGHAISLASPNDAILVGPATYYENLTINFNLGIIGSGASTTIIDGQDLNTVVVIPNSNTRVILAGFTIRNGAGFSYGLGGGGIVNFGVLRVFDTDVIENVAPQGAGIANADTLEVNHCNVSNNTSEGDYSGGGAGISSFGTLTINDSTISGNSSTTTDVYGAGIYNGGTMVINRSALNGNSTGGGYFGGGALYNDYLATATVNNSTLYGNTSDGFGVGGIINSGALSINSSTIVGNNETGISNGGTVTIQNSIVADNDGNCHGGMISNGYNLSSDNSCNFTGPGDLNNAEPKLGPLRNYGGPTQTMAEFLGSPTVDAGNPEGCTDGQGHLLITDQRGFPRPGKDKHDPRCDIGAFERQSD